MNVADGGDLRLVNVAVDEADRLTAWIRGAGMYTAPKPDAALRAAGLEAPE